MENGEEILRYLKKINEQNASIFKRLKNIEEIMNGMSAEQLEKFINSFSGQQFEIPSFGFPDIWKTTVIKSCSDKEAFKAIAAERKIQIIEDAGKVIDHQEFSILLEEDIEADLVLVSVRELGFNKGTYLNSIKKRAKKEGLVSFASEMAPLLRLCCREQPVEKIVIAMPPAKIYEEGNDKPDLVAFCLRDDGEYESLDIDGAHQHAFYGPDEFFLFVKPRK